MKTEDTNSKASAATEASHAAETHLQVDDTKMSGALQPNSASAKNGRDMQGSPDLSKAKEAALYVRELFRSLSLPSPDQITDMRVATFFIKVCEDLLRFWQEGKKWLVYDGKRWNANTHGGAFPLFKEALALLYKKASEIEDDDKRIAIVSQLIKLESHRRQKTLLEAAAVIPDTIIASSALDQNPMLLNCSNGTVNLKTGDLQPHSPEDFITRLVNIEYVSDAECPEFIRFLDRIMGGNTALIDYIQRYIGYCLTGNTSEQILVFFYGTGANGKTTLANVIEMLLGEYASTAGSSLLMHRDNNSASNDLAALRGARLVKVSEFDDGDRLAEATVKSLTGGDRISCRYLYGEFFEYTPQYKILLLGNHKPNIRGRDHGIWRRIHMVPFNVTIPDNERDPKLMEKLSAELSGILAWAVKGCLDWQKTGLRPPSVVKEEVKVYRQSEDIFNQWLDDCCITGDGCCASASTLLQSFNDYSDQKRMSPKKLGHLLCEAGFIKDKRGTVIWHGIALAE